MTGLALLGACAQQPPLGTAGGVTVVVVPEHSDGHVGAVFVRPLDGGEPLLLNKAYVATNVGASGEVRTFPVNPKRVNEEFASALAALPRSPARFQVNFIEGTDELNPDAKRTIENVVAEVSARPSPEIMVVGHTDFLGTDQYNDTLSLQRARRVRELLVRRGIPMKNIEVAGRGKREPLFPTPDGTAEPRNRRVEITVR